MVRQKEWKKKFMKHEKKTNKKKRIKIWDVDVDNTVISKLIGTKNISKNLTGYLDKMSGYVKTFKGKNNKLMSYKYIMNHQKNLFKHIFKSCNIYLQPERFRKSKFTLSKVKSE